MSGNSAGDINRAQLSLERLAERGRQELAVYQAALAWRQQVELQLGEWLRLMDDAETPDEVAWVVASVSERIRAVLAGGEEFAVLVRKLAQAEISEGDRG